MGNLPMNPGCCGYYQIDSIKYKYIIMLVKYLIL